MIGGSHCSQDLDIALQCFDEILCCLQNVIEHVNLLSSAAGCIHIPIDNIDVNPLILGFRIFSAYIFNHNCSDNV